MSTVREGPVMKVMARLIANAKFDETLGHAACFYAIAGIEGGLSTAGLALVKLDRAAGGPQHLDATRADGAPHLIDQTGDKQTDLHRRFPIVD